MDDRTRWEQLFREAAQDSPLATPRQIALSCVESLSVTGAGMSLVSTSGNRSAVCATDDLSAHIEELQVTLGEGPCVDAIERGAPILIGDITDHTDISTDRWPTFLSAAREAGVRAVFAFPLRIGAISIGALDLYRTAPGALSDEQLSGALRVAEVAGIALLGLQTDNDLGLIDNADAGAYQAQVHQATGIVSVQVGVPISQAFLLLRARAFATGRPLHELARDVVHRRLRFTPEDR